MVSHLHRLDDTPDHFPITPCTPSDIPEMYEVYNLSFGSQPTNNLIFPSVSPADKREWFLRRYALKLRDPELRYWKITDEREREGKGRMCAWMCWGFPLEGKGKKDEEGEGEEKEEEGARWPEGTNLEFVERHYGMLDRWEKKFVDFDAMYMAHFLCTSPEYQRKGFATRLLKIGLDKADQEGRKTYIDASPDGYALYLRLGFKEVERETFSLEPLGGNKEDLGGHVAMIREPVAAQSST